MSASSPFKLRVLIALCDLLKSTAFAYGDQSYSMSDMVDEHGRIVERVVRGRDRFGEGDPMPMLCILEDPKAEDVATSAPGTGATLVTWNLMVMGFAPNDLLHPTDPAYHFADAVETVLTAHREARGARGPDRNLLGFGSRAPCVRDMVIGESVVRPATPEVSTTAFFATRLGLTLVRPGVIA